VSLLQAGEIFRHSSAGYSDKGDGPAIGLGEAPRQGLAHLAPYGPRDWLTVTGPPGHHLCQPFPPFHRFQYRQSLGASCPSMPPVNRVLCPPFRRGSAHVACGLGHTVG